MFKITIDKSNAPLIEAWFKDSGGIKVWTSINMSNPGQLWITSYRDTRKPNWQCANTPEVITNRDEVGITIYTQVKRFHVAVRRGAQGLSWKLTDASTRKVRKALAAAGDGAILTFDYSWQDAIISVPEQVISLTQYNSVGVSA